MINLADKFGLTSDGKMLLENILQDPRNNSQGFHLTQERVGMILSIQDRITLDTSGRWRIAHKRAQGGHLNLERLRNKFYGSTK